jgi:hypothetical protein
LSKDRSRVQTRRAGVTAVALLLAAFLAPATARGAVQETYLLNGYEVWFTPTVGTFVGTGRGMAGELAGWQAAIEHSVVVSPTGTITGGWANLQRLDGVRIAGYFDGGSLELIDEGPGCTNEAHVVRGTLADVWRSDSSAVGTGLLEATLVHHRVWIFGTCISYSASVTATITLQF